MPVRQLLRQRQWIRLLLLLLPMGQAWLQQQQGGCVRLVLVQVCLGLMHWVWPGPDLVGECSRRQAWEELLLLLLGQSTNMVAQAAARDGSGPSRPWVSQGGGEYKVWT